MPREEPGAGQLERVQRRMQGYVVSGADAAGAAAMVRPSSRLTPLERLDIYRGMYEIRLVEALRVDYPGLTRYLGEEIFDELARMYLARYPSVSYTLNRLGDSLPDFVREVEGLRRPRFVESLARLELAETVVFDEEERAPLGPQHLAGVAEAEWPGLRLRPIPALRMLRLDYPAHVYLRGEEPTIPMRPKNTRLLVYRRNYRVQHLEMPSAAFAVFEALAGNATLGEATGAAKRARERDVFGWFQNWFSEGLFGSIG